MKAICYSLFGADRERYNGCFSFESYLTSLMLCVRFNRLVYPEWQTVLQTDKSTFDAFEGFFNYLTNRDIIRIEINPDNAELCRAMLWRLKPVFYHSDDGFDYTHVICRDLDSLSTYREAQAVQMWMNNNKAVHAITDSTSHNIPLLGGMIGFVPSAFRDITDIKDWDQLMHKCNIDLSVKGSDQKFLNQVVYPYFSKPGEDTITQHYFKGMGQTWLSDFHTCDCWLHSWGVGHKDGCPEDVEIPVSQNLKETNEISEHMGAAGFNHQQTMGLIKKYENLFEDLLLAEQGFPNIFFWVRK